MAGIAEVAARAGVSKATASRALSGVGYVSELTRTRVRDAAAELGYVPSAGAVGLATGRTQNIGVVMPHVNRWFFAEVLEGIQDSLLDRGLDLTLYDARPGTEGRARIFDEFLARKRFDGLIAVGLEPERDELERMLSLGKPVESVIGARHTEAVDTIDNEGAARRATEHLLALGHRRIAFLGGGVLTRWPHVESARIDGYHAAMADAGLATRHVPSTLSMPDGYAAAVDLLSSSGERPTGIVAACDEVAIGAIVAARRLGIQVPSGLSVIGIDDHELAEMFSLTTLKQVPRDQGRAAVEMLMRQIEDPAAPHQRVVLSPRLVARSSTAPAPGVAAVTGSVQ